MNENRRMVSPGIYGVIILCFFLPFASLSFQERNMAKICAMDLVTGTTIERTQVAPEPLAIFLLALTVIGLGLGFLKFKNSELLGSFAGAVGFILTIVLKAGIEDDVASESFGTFQVDSEIGYMLILLLFLAALGVNGYSWKYRQGVTDEKVIYCQACRTQNSLNNHTCSRCNHNLFG